MVVIMAIGMSAIQSANMSNLALIDRNVVTLQDPLELQQDGYSQNPAQIHSSGDREAILSLFCCKWLLRCFALPNDIFLCIPLYIYI